MERLVFAWNTCRQYFRGIYGGNGDCSKMGRPAIGRKANEAGNTEDTEPMEKAERKDGTAKRREKQTCVG